MHTKFYKYHGTGNDFIIIDNRDLHFDSKNQNMIAKMCHRRFGIGADGLILLENDIDTDFKMVYFNADGKESTMCGNGGRCIVAFAKKIEIITNKTSFIAIDGLHHAEINDNFEVNLQMKNVDEIENIDNDFVLDTGSPHYVKFVEKLPIEFVEEAKTIRNNSRFKNEGINVNFIEKITDNKVNIRTFERGVEDETYACGTGCVAAALSLMKLKNNEQKIHLITKGGNISVSANKNNSGFENIWLFGPTKFVFEANYNSKI